jgi:flavin reductase (DIM6/NTAB) family NADH-FMN oxidoreductase RutF
VGTYDVEGKPNVMTAAWGGICCSAPPCVAVSLREATYTYRNILERKAFTISIPSEKYVKEADYFGIASGKHVDKFAVTGLTPAKSEVVDAPYVDEFPFVLECQLLRSVEIGGHTQFIGEIKDIKVDEDLIKDGNPLIEKIMPLIFGIVTSLTMGLENTWRRPFPSERKLWEKITSKILPQIKRLIPVYVRF